MENQTKKKDVNGCKISLHKFQNFKIMSFTYVADFFPLKKHGHYKTTVFKSLGFRNFLALPYKKMHFLIPPILKSLLNHRQVID